MEKKKRGRPRKVKIPVESQKISSGFLAVLTMDGNEYRGEGQTVFDALWAIPLEYTQIKTKGIIRVETDGKSAEKLFYLKPLRMLFANELRAHGWARNFQDLLDSQKPPMMSGL